MGLWLAEAGEKGKTEVNGYRMRLGRQGRPGGLLHSHVNIPTPQNRALELSNVAHFVLFFKVIIKGY